MHEQTVAADHTAVRVALWRALHVQADPPPHVIDDEVGLRLAAPDEDWRGRPDMDVRATRRTRASIAGPGRRGGTRLRAQPPVPPDRGSTG